MLNHVFQLQIANKRLLYLLIEPSNDYDVDVIIKKLLSGVYNNDEIKKSKSIFIANIDKIDNIYFDIILDIKNQIFKFNTVDEIVSQKEQEEDFDPFDQFVNGDPSCLIELIQRDIVYYDECDNDHGESILIWASRFKKDKLAKLVVTKGSNINHIAHSNSQTALDIWIQHGDMEMIKFLIDHGAKKSKEIDNSDDEDDVQKSIHNENNEYEYDDEDNEYEYDDEYDDNEDEEYRELADKNRKEALEKIKEIQMEIEEYGKKSNKPTKKWHDIYCRLVTEYCKIFQWGLPHKYPYTIICKEIQYNFSIEKRDYNSITNKKIILVNDDKKELGYLKFSKYGNSKSGMETDKDYYLNGLDKALNEENEKEKAEELFEKLDDIIVWSKIVQSDISD